MGGSEEETTKNFILIAIPKYMKKLLYHKIGLHGHAEKNYGLGGQPQKGKKYDKDENLI